MNVVPVLKVGITTKLTTLGGNPALYKRAATFAPILGNKDRWTFPAVFGIVLAVH